MNDSATITKSRRRWLQFNLRSALVALTVVGLLLAAGVQWWKQVWREQLLADALSARGAYITMGNFPPQGCFAFAMPAEVPCITAVVFRGNAFTNSDLASLADLEHLESVFLEGTSISLAAIERCDEPREIFFPPPLARSLYEDCRRSGLSEWNLGEMIRRHGQALRWKLALARSSGRVDDQRQAHQECIDRLKWFLDPQVTRDELTRDLCLAQVTLMEMRLALLDHDPAKAIQIGRAWESNAKRLLAAAHPDFAGFIGTDNFLLAWRLAREIRCQTAELCGDQSAGLLVADETIANVAEPLKRVLGPDDEFTLQNEKIWAGRLVIALENEKVNRQRIACEAISYAADEKLVRRIRAARADVVSNISGTFRAGEDSTLTALEMSRRMLAEALDRHSELAQEDILDKQCDDYLANASVIDCLLAHAERTGEPTWDKSFSELGPVLKVLGSEPTLEQRFLEPAPVAEMADNERQFRNELPKLHNWRKEYAEELKLGSP